MMNTSDSNLNWLQTVSSNGVCAQKPELLYYQAKTSLINMSPKHALQARLAGQYTSVHKGRGMEFDEVRHYQPGDDIRMIDWRVTARTGTTHTKLFREEKERPVFIFTDLSDSMLFGSKLLFKSVQASHLAALLGWTVNKMGDRLGGLVFTNHNHIELKPKARTPGVLHYIHALEQQSAETNVVNAHNKVQEAQQAEIFSQACSRLRRLARPGSLVILISDFQNLSDASVKQLSLLSQHCELMAYRISDPLEIELPQSRFSQNLPVIHQGQTGNLQIGNKQAASLYHSEAQKLIEQQNTLLRRCRCTIQDVSAAYPLEVQFK
ncbi:DUF58 domain-containing protein [Catenovulum sediminis]|uniref:DUF58 domain-containing protein n=1 Tax=Catenovulum sediminis TaxID=1740262 RepID=A0ABV1RNC7_9ALTE|nr:DUF58 domain-containing protein [Catenovulum sediminis]